MLNSCHECILSAVASSNRIMHRKISCQINQVFYLIFCSKPEAKYDEWLPSLAIWVQGKAS